MELKSRLILHGEIGIYLFDAKRVETMTSAIASRDAREWLVTQRSPNLLVTGGLNVLAAALNWDFIQNQNSGWGSPFSSSQGNLGDMYGAVGTGNSTPVATQTQLDAESARSIVSSAAVAGASVILDAFLNTSQGNVSITEVAWFSGATSSANSGTMLDRTVLATAVTKTASNTALIELTLALVSG